MDSAESERVALANPQSGLRIHNKIIQDTVVFVQRTNGLNSTLLNLELMPGGGAIPHIHRTFEETFICQEGELSVLVAPRTVKLRPGETVTVPKGVTHRFFNDTAQNIRFRIEIAPGNRDFEDGLIILYGLANDGLTNNKSVPKNLAHLGLVSELGDLNLPFPMSLLHIILQPITARARKQGVLDDLRRRYCPLP